jgi:hypothetical protein
MSPRSALTADPQAPANEPNPREACAAVLRARLEGTPVERPALRSRLDELEQMFGLSAFETDVVAALWTAAYDPAWRATLAAAESGRGHLTVLGLMHAFRHEPRLRLGSESPLRLWRIVTEHPLIDGTAALSLDPAVLAWLDGQPELEATLVGRVRLVEPRFALDSWGLDARAQQIAEGVKNGDRWRIRLTGSDLVAAEACAAGLARRLGLLLLAADLEPLPRDEGHGLAVLVQRQAFLDRAAPGWRSRATDIAWPREVPPFPVQFVIGDDVLAGDERFRDLDIVVGDPDVRERRALWSAAVPSSASWPSEALDDLALRCEASPGEILRAAATGPRDAPEAARRLREGLGDDLQGLAQRLQCPFGWNDLVLPARVQERLEDVAFEARERARVWSQPEVARLYPQGRGLIVLLSGPPGTGKTMSAQVIAADLGLELLRVDLSRVVSKWVGETSQHLQRILSSPSSRRAVLLFDEADAVFGRRIEDAKHAQDHFVNQDLGHLMVAIESYTGVVLLATNLKANIDAAFVRRIRHSIDFQMPDAAARLAIWARAAAALFGSPLDPAVAEGVARVSRVDASGAQIKNAALSAVFAARRERRTPDGDLFGRMLARELAKDGNSVSGRELAAIIEAPL